ERENLVGHIRKIEEASRQWDTERRQLNDHAGQLQQAYMQAQAKIQAYEVASRETSPSDLQLKELYEEKEKIQREFHQARNVWDTERKEMTSHLDRLEQQLQRMNDTRERVSKEVVDQLRLQYEQKLQEAIKQKTQLAQELKSASSLLEAERARLAAAHASTGA